MFCFENERTVIFVSFCKNKLKKGAQHIQLPDSFEGDRAKILQRMKNESGTSSGSDNAELKQPKPKQNMNPAPFSMLLAALNFRPKVNRQKNILCWLVFCTIPIPFQNLDIRCQNMFHQYYKKPASGQVFKLVHITSPRTFTTVANKFAANLNTISVICQKDWYVKLSGESEQWVRGSKATDIELVFLFNTCHSHQEHVHYMHYSEKLELCSLSLDLETKEILKQYYGSLLKTNILGL